MNKYVNFCELLLIIIVKVFSSKIKSNTSSYFFLNQESALFMCHNYNVFSVPKCSVLHQNGSNKMNIYLHEVPFGD